MRLLSFTAAVLILSASGCVCVDPSKVSAFGCASTGCSEGQVCCTELEGNFCRTTCSVVVMDGGECTAGERCATNAAAPCRLGVTTCSGSQQSCSDGQNALDGLGCSDGGTDVCSMGSCVACSDGLSCATNPTPCKNGVLRCTAGGAVCEDGVGDRMPGALCGVDKVCTTTGACIDCAAGSTCTGNDNPCAQGTTSCGTGAVVCENGAMKAAGSGCGEGKVCDAAGACVTCVENEACASNPDPCKKGVLRCGSGAPACVDGEARAAGEECGTEKNRVCSPAGQCVTCEAGAACTGNPNVCKLGETSCTGGVVTCADGAGNASTTTQCGNGMTCNGAGTCGGCVQGVACTGNPNRCKKGVTDCQGMTATCVDDAAGVAVGEPCLGGFCDGAGACVPCAVGGVCTTNPGGACVQGVFARSGATCVCNDTTTFPGPMTTCAGGRCNGAGQCVTCAVGTACTANPNRCFDGVFEQSPVNAACTCVDNPGRARNNASCAGGYCWAGSCVQCAQGMTCSSNPGQPCKTGSFAWNNAGACPCGDLANNDNVTCAGGRCGGGSCIACAEGTSCNAGPCNVGSRTWNTANATCGCADIGDQPVNTVCPGGFCNATGACITCNVGAACTTNPSAPCKAGTLSFNGTSCQCLDGANQAGTCSGGVCANGACCRGCVNNSTGACLPGTTTAACGRGGAECGGCNRFNSGCLMPGDVPRCEFGTCVCGIIE